MDTKIILSATWVVVELIYLYGDVLRICSGDLAKKPMADMNLNQFVWLGIAILMLIPILMVFLALVLLKGGTLDATTYTLPVGIAQFIGQYSTPYELVAAAVLIVAVPVFILYLVLHRQFEQGVAEGAVKS